MSLMSASTATIHVTAPARLHLGFLDLNGGLGRRFGSIGLAVEAPATRLYVKRSVKSGSAGPEKDRTARLIEKFTQGERGREYFVTVEQAIPAHAGLGSGTQLALAVGTAIALLEGRHLDDAGLALLGDRGARSGIGLAAFSGGGFLIDGGKGKSDLPPPLTLRAPFPESWRVLLILDPKRAGVSGEAELQAFAALPEFSAASAAHICHLILMKLVPGLIETDIAAFGSALTVIQEIVGSHFASKQGGSAWTSPAVGRLANRMRNLGATGVGQSSWGPTGFAFVDSAEAASRLYHSLVEEAKGDGLEILITKGRNAGARIETV